MAEIPSTCYADVADETIMAHQVRGESRRDVMIRRNASVPADVMWENPQLGSFLDRLGAIGRARAAMAAWSAGPVVLVGIGELGTSEVLLALQDHP